MARRTRTPPTARTNSCPGIVRIDLSATVLVFVSTAAMAGALVEGRVALADTSPSPDFSSAAITLSVRSGSPNTYVTVTGTGFPPNELIEIYLDTPGTHLGYPGPKADGQGNFQESDLIPGVAPGAHVVCADTNYPSPQQFTAKACAPFTVTALKASTSRSESAPANLSGLPLPVVLIAIGVLVGIAIGAALWRRGA